MQLTQAAPFLATHAAPLTLRRFWHLYALVWLPLYVTHTLATRNDSFKRMFESGLNWPTLVDGLTDSLLSLGPAIPLLLLVWPLTGWLYRMRLPLALLCAIHTLGAVVFAVMWHAVIFVLLYLVFSPEAAQRSFENWFIWQAMWGCMMYGTAAATFHAMRAAEGARLQAVATLQTQTLLARTELVALRNKLNPHFLFNTLHSIIALTRSRPAQAETALLQFSEMLRYVLDTEKSGVDAVCFADELQFTRDYLALEQLRLGERLSVVWAIDDNCLDVLVPALSLQPMVENSIKHAFNPRSEPGQLCITAKVSNGVLNIQVSDNGPGCEPSALASESGLGITTVKRRLELAHPRSANLMRIDTAPGRGFTVNLALPIHSKQATHDA